MTSSSYARRGIRSILSSDTSRISTLSDRPLSRIKVLEPVVYDKGSKFKYLYRTAKWTRLRAEVLKRDMYTCQLCGAVGDVAGKLVCDHVRGHPPDETEEMFWKGPFQTVCETCHNTVRSKEDNERKRKWYVK